MRLKASYRGYLHEFRPQIDQLLAEGRTVKEVAEILYISKVRPGTSLNSIAQNLYVLVRHSRPWTQTIGKLHVWTPEKQLEEFETEL